MPQFERIKKLVALRLRELRKEAGYSSYRDFAEKNGIPRSQYLKMENGTNFTLKSLIKILDVHGFDFFEFMASVKKTS